MIFTNIATITLKNLYLTIPFKWIINIITIQLDNNSSFPYSKAIISSKCPKLIMMDSIKNLVLAILTICTKLQIIILYKAMKKIIFKSHNIYQQDNVMILKELNKSLMTMETQCHQMVSKPTKDQLQVLIFNKMGHIKTSKLIMPHNLSFK